MEPERKVASVQFGRNLLRYRRRLGLSQAALGRLTGLHRTEVSLLERGRREPRLGTIVKLADSLEVPLDMLFEGTDWTIERPPSDGP